MQSMSKPLTSRRLLKRRMNLSIKSSWFPPTLDEALLCFVNWRLYNSEAYVFSGNSWWSTKFCGQIRSAKITMTTFDLTNPLNDNSNEVAESFKSSSVLSRTSVVDITLKRTYLITVPFVEISKFPELRNCQNETEF